MQEFHKQVDAAVEQQGRQMVVMALKLSCPMHEGSELVPMAEHTSHPVYGSPVGLLACPRDHCVVGVIVQLTEEELAAHNEQALS